MTGTEQWPILKIHTQISCHVRTCIVIIFNILEDLIVRVQVLKWSSASRIHIAIQSDEHIMTT